MGFYANQQTADNAWFWPVIYTTVVLDYNDVENEKLLASTTSIVQSVDHSRGRRGRGELKTEIHTDQKSWRRYVSWFRAQGFLTLLPYPDGLKA